MTCNRDWADQYQRAVADAYRPTLDASDKLVAVQDAERQMANRLHALTQQIGSALMAVETKGIIQQRVYNAIGKVRECRCVHD
jgi:GTP1/Obg family GTP-binding protein